MLMLSNLLLPLVLGLDPRHQFDKRCPPAFTLDAVGKIRDPTSHSRFMNTTMAAGATAMDCAFSCCHDWSCEAFTFYPSAVASPCKGSSTQQAQTCCIFLSDVDALVVTKDVTIRSGVRSKLSAVQPPYPKSTAIKSIKLNPKFLIGINGDEFPITWGKDGHQYTGAGDNKQHDGLPTHSDSPLSFFRVQGGPTEMGCTNPATNASWQQPTPECKNITMQGVPVPVQNAAAAAACPKWHSGVPNLKSSGVLSVDGVLYWAISCFDYGDDPVFDRQRYGPAWIITSADGGVTWDLNATQTGKRRRNALR